ncbi:MAG: DUF1624 domain-containing protein [Acidobacteriota bacterium]|nr:DUF1624 domain-containing protein [Acidobacteriota bacterium]
MKATATPRNNRDSGSRLTFLDWTRGAAVVSMLQGHVFHSFVRQDLRTDGPYVISQLFGGIGPAVFLVLTGITLAFLMDKREREGMAPQRRWLAALRRAGYLFMIAILFRLQLWLFAAGQSPWTDLFKVDVLNLMGFAIALMSVLAVLTTADRVRIGALLGVAIAAASPLISALDWTWLPPQMANYIVPNFNYFAFFPWAAFIAFGISIGSILRLTSGEQMNRVMQWSALGGFALILGGEYFSNLQYSVYPKSDFWLNSPELILMKLGVVMLVLSVAFLWTEYGLGNSWSWVRQLGTTSLLVYWVHIELVYGRWFGFWKDNLNNVQVGIVALSVIGLMVLLSVARTHWRKFPFPAFLAGSIPVQTPRRVSGD